MTNIYVKDIHATSSRHLFCIDVFIFTERRRKSGRNVDETEADTALDFVQRKM